MKPLTVGKKYPHSITTRGVTAVYYQLYKFGHRLYIYLNSISEDTASKFRDGQLEFALFHQENVFILLLRVVKMEFPHSSDPAEHTLIEMDAPFCLYDVPEIWRPDTSDAIDGMAMRVVLIDVTNNMGRAFRITHTRGGESLLRVCKTPSPRNWMQPSHKKNMIVTLIGSTQNTRHLANCLM